MILFGYIRRKGEEAGQEFEKPFYDLLGWRPASRLGVIPAKAGIYLSANELSARWIPAFAGMTAGGNDALHREVK
jgi:hypothetical protein